MRKILSAQNSEQKRKRNQITLAFFLLFIMFFSVLGYSFQSISDTGEDSLEGEKITYNGFTFTSQGNFWILNSDGKNFIFRYNPNEVPEVNSSLDDISQYKDVPLYIYSKSYEQESEIRTNLLGFALRIQNACPENETCSEDLPKKSCEDNFIIIKEGNDGVIQNGNCVYISGKKEDLTKLTDSFLFKILGISS